MVASILAILKALVELFGLGKWVYNETKETPSQKEAKIEAANNEQKEEAKKDGRPKWD